MASTDSSTLTIVDGSMDWSGGVDSSKVPSIQSALNPNGLKRTQLAWLTNASVRGGGITQRFGWQPLAKLIASGRWQGGFIYEPDEGNPYLVCSVSGVIYSLLLEAPYTVTDLTGGNDLLRNPADAEMAWFCQGENYLVIQAGDYYTGGVEIPGKTDTYGSHLPLFWDGATLRRSIGITTPAAPDMLPNINEIPAATCMEYFGGRIWYAQARSYSAGDIVGGPSGNAINRYRDSILSVTENPLCYSGDGFTVPTNAGNIRAIKHSASLNASLGEGQLYIGTRKAVYSLIAPVSRADWIAAGNSATGATTEMPIQTVVQLVNGFVGDRSVCPVNGDLYYQSFDPAVRSLIRAVQYFNQPGNTAVSQNEQRALQFNDRSLMRFSSSIYFDSRILNLALPELGSDGVNVIHRAILPLDFDVVTNFEERKAPVWEGAWEGLDFVQLFNADFGGLDRAFAVVLSNTDGSLNLWELTSSNKMENGDNRITWSPEWPSFSWAEAGYEYSLKQLCGGECWIDRVSGTVQMDIYYRTDAEPCWRKWFDTTFCATRWEDVGSTAYPCEPLQEGYVFPVVFPEPPFTCNAMGVRPTTIGYRFQVKMVIKGFCRICGLLLYAYPKMREQYKGLVCSTSIRGGMTTLPDPFTATVVPDSACIQTGTTSTGIITQSQAIPPPDQGQPPVVPPACSITTTSLAAGVVGNAYSQQIEVTAESTVYSYAVTGGALPAGLSLSSTTGVISGTPTTEGSYSFTVTVSGAIEMSCSREFSITISHNSWNDNYIICGFESVSGAFPGMSNAVFDEHRVEASPPGVGNGWLESIGASAVALTFTGTSWTIWSYTGSTVSHWFGTLASTNSSDPSGTYTRLGGDYAYPTITIVAESNPELCP
jgi:hypothetical protein